ncbi:uncharacterized protein LOC142576387 [Dermacentor variabilis]|uniref:uncharacterized protein LOC142576387 n=1 Tax=Dermacentor variabilis TaxID=34621 RepID=UPI003F5B8145
MVMGDANLRIMVIDPRFPGGCHDLWVWRQNPLRSRLGSQLQPGEYLLGDSEYTLEPWLLTSVPGHPAGDTLEGRFNRAHASMRNVVERCTGVLKSRFCCLQRYRTMLYSPDRAATIIGACAALHNIALKAGEPRLKSDDMCLDVPPAAAVPRVPGVLPEERRLLPPQDICLRGRQECSDVVTRSTECACYPRRTTASFSSISSAGVIFSPLLERRAEGLRHNTDVVELTQLLTMLLHQHVGWPCQRDIVMLDNTPNIRPELVLYFRMPTMHTTRPHYESPHSPSPPAHSLTPAAVFPALTPHLLRSVNYC